MIEGIETVSYTSGGRPRKAQKGDVLTSASQGSIKGEARVCVHVKPEGSSELRLSLTAQQARELIYQLKDRLGWLGEVS